MLTGEIIALALGVAASLTLIDVIYVYRQVILPIYLVDAMLQIAFIIGWSVCLFATQRPPP